VVRMTETNEEKGVFNKDQWRERTVEQERSGVSVRQFCQTRGIGEHLFYYWRKRLREQQQPMRFALVERGPARQAPASEASLELILADGERVRIGARVDATTLRMVLTALRA
jgi:transposase-like protein